MDAIFQVYSIVVAIFVREVISYERWVLHWFILFANMSIEIPQQNKIVRIDLENIGIQVDKVRIRVWWRVVEDIARHFIKLNIRDLYLFRK